MLQPREERGAGWGRIRYSQLELKALCELLTRTLCRAAFREQGRGMGTTVGLQPQTVSKWVSICLSTQRAGRITPTAQSHHGSYPHRRRWGGGGGGISKKRLSLICQSNKRKKEKNRKPVPLLLLTLCTNKRRASQSTGHRAGSRKLSLRWGSTDPQAAHALRAMLSAPLPTLCTPLSVLCAPNLAPHDLHPAFCALRPKPCAPRSVPRSPCAAQQDFHVPRGCTHRRGRRELEDRGKQRFLG